SRSKENMVYKTTIMLVFVVLLAGLTGCGSDEKGKAIAEAIQLIGDVTSTYSAIKTDLTRAIDKHKKEKNMLSDEDWKPVAIKAEEIKKIAERLQRYKGHFESFREITTAEQK